MYNSNIEYMGGQEELSRVYEITLADGSKISGLTLNGNNFVSKTRVTEEMFDGNMSHVVITDDQGNVEEHDNMELLQIATYPDMEGWFFVIRDIPEEMLYRMKLEGSIDYIAMMASIDM